MKKAFVLLLVLAVLGSAAFAWDPTVVISGAAGVTWGVDLNTNKTGFTADTTSLVATLRIATGSATKGGAEGDEIYGLIEVSGVQFNMYNSPVTETASSLQNKSPTATATSLPKVKASIVFGETAYIVLYNKADALAFDYASIINTKVAPGSPAAATNQYTITPMANFDNGDADGNVSPLANVNPGVTIGFKFEPAVVQLHVFSADAFTDRATYSSTTGVFTDATPKTNNYIFGADANIDLDALTLGFYGSTGLNFDDFAQKNAFFYGLTVGYDMDTESGKGLALSLNHDGELTAAQKFNAEFSANVTFGLSETAAKAAATKLTLDASYGLTEGVAPGLDVKFAFANPATQYGIIPWARLELGVWAYDIFGGKDGNATTDAKLSLGFTGAVGYQLNLATTEAAGVITATKWVYPQVSFGYALGELETELDERFDLNVQVAARIIPNTTFTLRYNSLQLLDNMTAVDHFNVDVRKENFRKADKGQITFATSISF